jgi:hypothetical protein
MTGPTPLSYITKAGAATAGEVAKLPKADRDILKQWAADEMKAPVRT